MDRIPSFFQLDRYGISPGDVVETAFHCAPEQIQSRVVLMPSWSAEIFSDAVDKIIEITPGSVYSLEIGGQLISLIRSGIGAPQTGDTMLALACTPCECVVFAGSAGGLGGEVQIGDMVVVEKSVCGDGFSRHLQEKSTPDDIYEHPSLPDHDLTLSLERNALKEGRRVPVCLHRGVAFSTDSIMTQFFRIDHFENDLGCIAIEMETAACFNAARVTGIRAGALLLISDLPGRKKSLFAGREEQERERYRIIRRNVLSRVVLDVLLEA